MSIFSLEAMKISASTVHQMIDRQPSVDREIGQILVIHRAAIQEGGQPPAPLVPIDGLKDNGCELAGGHKREATGSTGGTL